MSKGLFQLKYHLNSKAVVKSFNLRIYCFKLVVFINFNLKYQTSIILSNTARNRLYPRGIFIELLLGSADPDQTEFSLSESTLFARQSKVTERKFINMDILISSLKYQVLLTIVMQPHPLKKLRCNEIKIYTSIYI